MEAFSKEVNEELRGFLEEENVLSPHTPTTCGQRIIRCHITFSYLLNILLASLLLWRLSRPWDPSQGIYSPANSVIEYETKVFSSGVGPYRSQYQGYPNTDIDKAWDELYQYGINLHVPEYEARRLPNKTVGIPGMPGQYIIGLDVFHQLHCLNMFRKLMYPERYGMVTVFANGTRDDETTLHFKHLRQATMCHADVSTLYHRWDEEDKMAKMPMNITHTCRNFEKIKDWAFARYFANFNRYTLADWDAPRV